MSLFSGLWRKFRKLFSRTATTKNAPQIETAEESPTINKDLAELAAELRLPKVKSAVKTVKTEAAPPESVAGETAAPNFAVELLSEVSKAESPKTAAPVVQQATAPEPVKEEKRPAAEVATQAKAAPPPPVTPTPKPPAIKLDAPKADKLPVQKAPVPAASAKPKKPATVVATSTANSKGKAVAVKGPKVTIPDKRVRPSSTTDPQRLARLLVSEIKLYNEKKVSEGLQNNNLYDLLKKTIDQSLEHYRSTVGDSTEQPVNYFHDELVKTLCDGDPAKLGPNFPSLRV